ncbi:uncharacterized protein LOC135486492 isoform X1 [Lineus longissimus]|uniref:uncharacterized protein LOC135486304 n=1 Tax=Lineus longissimus TaxID=88925 RepID=UPI00315CD155
MMAIFKRDQLKTYVVACAFLGLCGWMAVLQTRYERRIKLLEEEGSVRVKRSAGSSGQTVGGATYIRWGRTVCPADAELVYAGYGGAQHYTHVGGSAEYICVSDKPEYASKTAAGETDRAWLNGIELQVFVTNFFSTANADPNGLHDSDLRCAVCRNRVRTSMLMIPGTKSCPGNWQQEYWGYLMTGHYKHKAAYSYACVDDAPEAGGENGARNDDGGLMYHAQGSCGSLPCPPYVQGFEMTCVVCTK